MIKHSVRINLQNVTELATCYMIKCPHKSNYDGCYFFHPRKFAKQHKGSLIITYFDGWQFKLYKKRELFDVVDTVDIENMFPIYNNDESYLIVEEPKKIDIGDVNILDELKNE